MFTSKYRGNFINLRKYEFFNISLLLFLYPLKFLKTLQCQNLRTQRLNKKRKLQKAKICEYAWLNTHLIQWKNFRKESDIIKRNFLISLNRDKCLSKYRYYKTLIINSVVKLKIQLLKKYCWEISHRLAPPLLK